jgi:mevalonate pyrophosphate decarboxylase
MPVRSGVPYFSIASSRAAIQKSVAFDAMVEKSEENLKELKELQKAFEAERIGLKKRSV